MEDFGRRTIDFPYWFLKNLTLSVAHTVYLVFCDIFYSTFRGESSKRYNSSVNTSKEVADRILWLFLSFRKFLMNFFSSLSLGMNHMWCFDKYNVLSGMLLTCNFPVLFFGLISGILYRNFSGLFDLKIWEPVAKHHTKNTKFLAFSHA